MRRIASIIALAIALSCAPATADPSLLHGLFRATQTKLAPKGNPAVPKGNHATPKDKPDLEHSSYAPERKATCPAGNLVEPARAISKDEAAYVAGRIPKANHALQEWLAGVDPVFKGATKLPVLGMAQSGGGYRALLIAAGMIQAMDKREKPSSGVSGLYQALTYQSGLSGGSWLLASQMSHDWAPISKLKEQWLPAFAEGLAIQLTKPAVWNDVRAKAAGGGKVTMVDAWARSLGRQLLGGANGGAGITMSSIQRSGSFVAKAVPFPIITALEADTHAGNCKILSNAPQFEFSPFSFGSWDRGISSFIPMHFLGSRPASASKDKKAKCMTGLDSLGFLLGISSNLFNAVCSRSSLGNLNDHKARLAKVVSPLTDSGALYGMLPNPFFGSHNSPTVAHAPNLRLVDGGMALENVPIYPFIQPGRHVDVLFISDQSGTAAERFLPNGSSLYQTYRHAQQNGLTRMPHIPEVPTILHRSLQGRQPLFFGCHDHTKVTLIWVPNTPKNFASGQSHFKLKYTAHETNSMIENGQHVMARRPDKSWPKCVACAIMHKVDPKVAKACAHCLQNYCVGK